MTASNRWPDRRTGTVYLQVPRHDWPKLAIGEKTEVRVAGRYARTMLKPPTPMVIFTSGARHPRLSRLVVCEEAWQEPLGAISPESLAREGFASLAEFRAYWRTYRTKRTFPMLSRVWCYRLRAWQPEDRERFALQIFDHLYGMHLK